MAESDTNRQDRRQHPRILHLALIYAVVASLWIMLSDISLSWITTDPSQMTRISIIKGILFVSFTTLLLYGLLYRAASRARQATERELQLQRERLDALQLLASIAESSTDAIFAKDIDGRYALFNKAAEANTGKTAAEVIGQTDQAIFPPDQAELVMADDHRIMQQRKVLTWEHTLQTQQGIRTFLTTQGPLFDGDGNMNGVFGIARDITQRKQAETALRESEKTYRSLFENMLNSVAHCRVIFENERPIDLEYLAVNPAFEQMTGLKDVIGRHISEVIPGYPEDNRDSLELFGKVATGGKPQRWEHRLAALQRWFSFSVYSPAPGEIVIVGENITERKEAEIELLKLSLAVEQSPESIMITDLAADIEYVNQAFVDNTGYSREEVKGQNPRLLQSGNTPPATYKALWQTISSGKTWQGELHNRRKNGSEYIELAIISPLRQPSGKISHYVAIKQDITEQKFAAAEIHRLAFYDSLTGLANRALLQEHMRQELAATSRGQHQHGLILLNIDRFKTINDAGGPTLGDALLQALGKRLGQTLRDGDVLARLDGDEFAIMLPELAHKQHAAAHQALHVAEKIQANLVKPFHLEGQTLGITACLGIALFPDGNHDSAEDVLRRGNTALHYAKSNGTAQITFFENSLDAIARERFDIEQELRQALARKELRLYLQPQFDAQENMTGAEALVRWQHPQRGLMTPGSFIPVAEESDIIIAIGEWVFGEVCKLLARPDVACHPIRISVNISPNHFRQPDFLSWLKRVLSTTGADPARLTLEITEGLIIDNFNDAREKMAELAAIGIHFSMDDFGTGYSSLAYLKRLPLHELKIDKTFIQDAPSNPNDAALVETILAVAQHLHLRIVAEGVETREQADFLNQRAEVIHQGYLFSQPTPVEAWLQDWINHNNPPC